MLLKDKLDKVVFILLCILVIIFPVNYEVVPSLRVFDIFYIFTFFLFLFINFKVQKIYFLLVFWISILLLLSMWNGYFQSKPIEIQKIVFVYKYFLLFTVPLLVSNIVNTPYRVKIINRLMIWIFIALLTWVYLYLVLNHFGIINGNKRPSFPFSENYQIPDSHLLSSTLGFLTVTYLFYWRIFFKHNIFISLLVTSNALFVLLFTGSRTGIVLIVFTVVVYFSYVFIKIKKIKLKKSNYLKYILFCIILISLFLFFQDKVFYIIEKNIWLIERALNFDLENDASSQGRIAKLFISWNDLSASGYILGLGILSSSLIWYDGVIAILLAHGGILLLVSFLSFIVLVIYKSYLYAKYNNQKIYFLIFLLLLITYILSNGITEYVFVSRNGFSALLILSLLYTINKNKILTNRK